MNMEPASTRRHSETPRAEDSTGYMLLTGASRGIGHATVKLFQEYNWRALTVSRQPFSEDCKWPAARDSHIQADFSNPNSVERIAEEVRRRLPDGKLHALVNNAGISPKAMPIKFLRYFNERSFVWHHIGFSVRSPRTRQCDAA